MKMNITFDSEYYNADDIEHGAAVQEFANNLIKNVFKKGYVTVK